MVAVTGVPLAKSYDAARLADVNNVALAQVGLAHFLAVDQHAVGRKQVDDRRTLFVDKQHAVRPRNLRIVEENVRPPTVTGGVTDADAFDRVSSTPANVSVDTGEFFVVERDVTILGELQGVSAVIGASNCPISVHFQLKAFPAVFALLDFQKDLHTELDPRFLLHQTAGRNELW